MKSWFGKDRFIGGAAVLTLALAVVFSPGAWAQTTDEGSGPSEQPNAPMEMGQPQAPQLPQGGDPGQAGPPPQADQGPPGAPPQLGQPQEQGQGEEAQPGGPSGEGPAEVKQGVGRISMIHGAVSTQRGDSGDWSAAILNQPVVMGDKVSTGDGGRGEVQLDYANILRLGPNSQVNLSNFTKKFIQVQVAQGIANYSVFGESEAEPEIDTPNVGIHPAHQNGVFRIEVRPDGDSIIIVRKGEAQISTPQGIANIKAGDMATVRGTGADARYKISPAPERDDWDRWNSDRDRMVHSADAWHHTNKYYVGSEDLDRNGRWLNAPDYGQVWVPNEPEGWAPYRDGNWTWEPYYGWTWVGYEPWGWAPYHYGRWFPYGGAWAWWPGPVWGPGFYRPFWAPAYVSFFGFGGGWGVGFGFGWGGWGGFGWLPCGPGDWFHPWWGGYGGRFGVVGFNHFAAGGRFGGIGPLRGRGFSNVAHFNDARVSRGLSTVGAREFGSGRTPAVAASRAQLSSAHMMTGNMPVVPTHASLSASGRAAAPGTVRNTSSEHFFGTQSGARTESFQQQTARLQSSMQANHFSPITAGGRMGGSEARGLSASGKPSAGLPASGRETNGGRSEAGGAHAQTETGIRGGSSASASRGEQGPSAGQSAGRGEPNRSEWKVFTPPSHSNDSSNRAGSSEGAGRGEGGSYWNRTTTGSSYSRGAGSGAYERGGGSRPQLSMRQPIVQPRSSGGYGSYGSRGPSYGGSRSYGGYSGGGSHAAPSSGGHASGGGGHSKGGSHFFGGASHSSGGGGHSGGGHSGGGGHHR
jgi:hypothetical protein